VGDKAYSTVFDNAKLRNLVPDFKATVPFSAGIQETVAWFDADPGRQEIDAAANERWDRLARVYGEALLRQPAVTGSPDPVVVLLGVVTSGWGRLVAGVRLIHPPRPAAIRSCAS